jgi:hypothetical protein
VTLTTHLQAVPKVKDDWSYTSTERLWLIMSRSTSPSNKNVIPVESSAEVSSFII